jgi:hypothetical protein
VETVLGVKILDGTEPGGPGGLEFDLSKILAALGKAASKSRWTCSDLNYVSRDERDVPALERAATPGEQVAGLELLEGTRGVLQVIDGQFTGIDEEGEAWVVIRAVDSSWWEVWSDNKWVHDAIRRHFRVVENISAQAFSTHD